MAINKGSWKNCKGDPLAHFGASHLCAPLAKLLETPLKLLEAPLACLCKEKPWTFQICRAWVKTRWTGTDEKDLVDTLTDSLSWRWERQWCCYSKELQRFFQPWLIQQKSSLSLDHQLPRLNLNTFQKKVHYQKSEARFAWVVVDLGSEDFGVTPWWCHPLWPTHPTAPEWCHCSNPFPRNIWGITRSLDCMLSSYCGGYSKHYKICTWSCARTISGSITILKLEKKVLKYGASHHILGLWAFNVSKQVNVYSLNK